MNEKEFRRLAAEGRVALDVARIPAEGERISGETGDILDLRSRYIRPAGGVEYDLSLSVAGGELLVRGRVKARLHADCSRCMRPFSFEVEVPGFAEMFEIPEDDCWIDITDALREAVILEIPPFPVHDPDCKGLCPQCGADLNEGPCSCRPAEGDSRWSALDGLEI